MLGFVFGICLFTARLLIIKTHYTISEETQSSTVHIFDATTTTAEQQFGCNNPLKLIFMVMSSPFGAPKRAAIRRSWMLLYNTMQQVEFTIKFVIGTKGITGHNLEKLLNELNQFNDMLYFDDFEDNFYNLTNKVLRSITWAHEHYEFEYLIKCDDDTFIQIDRFVKALHKLNCPRYLYWGYFSGNGQPDSNGKWAERQWYLCPHFIPYAVGGGYVLSWQLVNVIANLSGVLQIYNNEDVTVGLWMAPFNVTRFHDLRFNCEGHSHGCNNNYIVMHKEKAAILIQRKISLLYDGKLCSTERELRPAYIYNWTVPPHLCCQRQYGIPIPE